MDSTTNKADSHVGLKIKEKVSYGIGDFSSNLVWGLIGSYLLFFYTNVALIPVAFTGTLFLVARMLDAVIDPVIGGFVDRTDTKLGRTLPYIRYGIIPLAIIYILTFCYFPGSTLFKVIYAYITYILVGIFYSLVNVPYGSLMTLMTRDSAEKAQLSSLRVAFAAIGSIFVTGLAMPIVKFFGHGNDRLGFFITAIIFALVGIVGFEIVSHNCKERYLDDFSEQVQAKHKASILSTYKNAFRNRAWVTTVLLSLLLFIRIGVIVAITIYFANYVLKSPMMISILLPVLYVGQLLSTLFSSQMIAKFGHRKTNIIGNVGMLISYIFLPFLEHNLVLFTIVYLAGNVIGAVSASSVFGMNADSVDYNEWKFGVRSEGTLYAGYSFSTKVGMAIGSALAGYALSWIHFSPKAITPSVVSGLNILFYALPAILTVLMIIVAMFYNLDAKHGQIVKELNNLNYKR
ncbi:glycoside-pentoside-hexuronide (GPH):cation symporter [Limosilactobacillus difficilis]|uniref:glycoside-pentoside-hexuronide (GPH):cation symporter n=1 Tax=Limosilactobacillus difficilis TaxID=2991838 RepID=UPI0024BA4FF8|nr:glycoside-pentoside-hexuronide (GPH):cation symporter [Limosilactobacillus difficilis]